MYLRRNKVIYPNHFSKISYITYFCFYEAGIIISWTSEYCLIAMWPQVRLWDSVGNRNFLSLHVQACVHLLNKLPREMDKCSGSPMSFFIQNSKRQSVSRFPFLTTEHYITFKYIVSWFGICIYCKTTVSPANTHHHT